MPDSLGPLGSVPRDAAIDLAGGGALERLMRLHPPRNVSLESQRIPPNSMALASMSGQPPAAEATLAAAQSGTRSPEAEMRARLSGHRGWLIAYFSMRCVLLPVWKPGEFYQKSYAGIR